MINVKAQHADIWNAIADALRPRARVRPSTWCSQNIVLEPSQSPRPGPMDPDFKPWTRWILDACYEQPEKKGLIAKKPTQVGFSTGVLALLVCMCATDPGPCLYVTTDKDKALDFADSEFMPMVESVPSVATMFSQAAKDRRELSGHKPFAGGVIDFVGAGSESGVISKGRRYVVLDEYQRSSELFPAASGDLWGTAIARLTMYKDSSLMFAFSHPRYENEDIDLLYKRESTMERGVFDCPHCRKGVAPRWSMVRFAGSDEGQLNPETAKFHCPHCDKAISDTDRSRSIRASLRRESSLSIEEQRKRPYIGLEIHRLCDFDVTLEELARQFANSKTEEERQTFFNKWLGEEYTRTRGAISVTQIEEAMKPMQSIVVPGGRLGCRFLCVGCDVQAPRHNPTFYCAAVAYAASGMAYVVDMQRLSGVAAYHQYLRTVGVTIDQAFDGAAAHNGRLWCRLATIDTRYETGTVLDACRESVYCEHGFKVEQLPVAYQQSLNADNPAMMANDRKRTHPSRPDLGMIDYYYLWRHSWVDRVMKRIQEKRIQFLCRVPDDLMAHLTANTLRPVPKQHGMDREALVWTKPDEFRDDWAQALMYAEAGAALKLRLDSIHAIENAPQAERPTPTQSVRPGWMRTARSWGSR